MTGEGLQILTYARHIGTFSSEPSLACHTYYGTRHPFIMSSLRTRDTHTCVQISGNRVVEFEERKCRKVDLISFDTTIEIFVYNTKHSDLSSYFYTYHTS